MVCKYLCSMLLLLCACFAYATAALASRCLLGHFIPDEYFFFTTAFVDRGSLICENTVYFLFRGGKNF